MAKHYSKEIQNSLIEIVQHFDKEDTSARERQIRTWRQLKLFWEGVQKTWYSEVAHDWRIWDGGDNEEETDQASYDKPVNVFRAYLESIIAALSVTVPPIKCYPDDADNTLDLSTAKAGDKIAQLIYRHNNVSLLWLHALFIYCTEGVVAAYTYPKTSEKYGTYDKKDFEEVEELHQTVTCPECGYPIEDTTTEPLAPLDPTQMDPSMMDPTMQMPGMDPNMMDGMPPPEMGGGMPMSPEMGMMGQPPQEEQPPPLNMTDEFQPEYDFGQEVCPACMAMINPEISQEKFVTTRLVGQTKEPKTRICMEAHGGLYVKIPNYAKKQEDCLYLIYSYETHFANAIERFEHITGKEALDSKKIHAEVGPHDPYELYGRLSPQYQGEYPENVVTIRNVWLRPAAFNVIFDVDKVKELKKHFPKGVKVVLVNDLFGEAVPEVLDDVWTLTYNPLSDYIHHDPLGLLLVSIQEITNDLISLILQTIEHGIGQTFADPGVLDFPAYRATEAIPGGVYEAIPKSGKSLNDSFHEMKTASLSPEIMPFAQNIQSLAQLVSGALPSLFGGALEGSETASQYSMSRAQALQRLQNVWKIFTTWWKEIFGKVIPTYINEVKDDEKDVQKDQNGNFINVFIRKAELEGKIGKVELEANENLPLTWNQQKDIIMQLLQAGNPQILEILGMPQNLPVIRDAIGLVDFYVPGEDDRAKQYDEIKLLLNSEPIPTGNPEMPEMPSIEPDPDIDNHEIEYEIIRSWAVSEAGRQAKIDNPPGYKNVLLHGKFHQMIMTQLMMQEQQNAEGAAPSAKPDKSKTQEAPITGEKDVQTTA